MDEVMTTRLMPGCLNADSSMLIVPLTAGWMYAAPVSSGWPTTSVSHPSTRVHVPGRRVTTVSVPRGTGDALCKI